MTLRCSTFFLPVLTAALLLPSPASATVAADISGSVVVAEPNGFPGACDQPCFSAEKSFEVFLAGNPTAPGVCSASENTYVYTIAHLGGGGPFVPALTRFEIGVPNAGVNVTSAGFIPGALDPSATTINTTLDQVEWDFLAPTIANGATSSTLFVCSPLAPGTVNDTPVSIKGQASLDAPGTCVGPFEAPTPTPTATPAPLNHFQCYGVRRQPFDAFSGLSLEDQLGPGSVEVSRITRFCNPASKQDEDPGAVGAADHLMAFKIRQEEPRFRPIPDVEVTNQFGSILVDVLRPVAMLVPSAKSLAVPVGAPSAPAVNHFKCYAVKRARQRRNDLSVEDQFGTLTVDVKRPRWLCNPANKQNEDPAAVDDPEHLMCYQIRSRPRYADFEGPIWFGNQFLSGVIDARRPDGTRPTELCVPSTKRLPDQ